MLHCPSLRRTIFAKLDSKINARLLSNEHGDLNFLVHNNNVHIILFDLRRLKKIIRRKTKKIGESVHENRYSEIQIMTAKIMSIRTLHVHVVLNSVIFLQILYDIIPHARHFLPVTFFPCITLINYHRFQLPQSVTWTDE